MWRATLTAPRNLGVVPTLVFRPTRGDCAMPPRRKRRPAPDLETNTPPNERRGNGVHGEPPDSRPLRDDTTTGEDMSPSEYERELDRLDAATSTRH